MNDTIAELDLNNPILHLGNVKRKNIRFDISCRPKNKYGEKLKTIKKILFLKKYSPFLLYNIVFECLMSSAFNSILSIILCFIGIHALL